MAKQIHAFIRCKKYIIVRLLVFLCVLCSLLLLGVNLFINSSYVSIRVEEKISGKLGYDCDLGRMSWTPWGHLRIREIKLYQGEIEIVQVKDVSITPYYRSVPEKVIYLREIVIEDVSSEKSPEELLQLVKHLASRLKYVPEAGQAMEKAEPLVASQNTIEVPHRSDSSSNSQNTESGEQGKLGKSPVTTSKRPENLRVENQQSIRQQSDNKRVKGNKKSIDLRWPDEGHPLRLHVKNINGVLHLGGNKVKGDHKQQRNIKVHGQLELALDGKNDDVTAGAGNAESSFTFSLYDNQRTLVENHAIALLERDHVIHTLVEEAELDSNKYNYQLGVQKSGAFFVYIENKDPSYISTSDHGDVWLRGDSYVFQARMGGYITKPNTYAGNVSIHVESLNFTVENERYDFDRMEVDLHLRHGSLHYRMCDLVSDQFSIKVRGDAHASGGLNLVSRVVAAPYLQDDIELFAQQSEMELKFQSLDTPDQGFVDVFVFGGWDDVQIEASDKAYSFMKKVSPFMEKLRTMVSQP